MFTQIESYLTRNSMENLFNSKYSFDLWLKACHINLMTQIAMQMADRDDSINKDLLYVCCMHHDDGSSIQYQQYGEFNDNKISHHALGLDMLDRYIMANNVTMTPEIQILRACIYYHGRIQLAGNTLDDETKKYVQLVSDADEIEQYCIAPVGYLPRKIANDTLFYRLSAPHLDRKIRPKFFEYYKSGQWPNEFYGCNSYAEELLYETSFAIKCIKKHGAIVKSAMQLPCYAYSSAVKGYTDLFSKCMTRKDANLASEILLDILK